MINITPPPGMRFRDRRRAASDEFIDGDERRNAREFAARGGWRGPGPTGRDGRTYSGRWIYGSGTRARAASMAHPDRFSIEHVAADRLAQNISTVILHQTDRRGRSGGHRVRLPGRTEAALPDVSTDSVWGYRGRNGRIDEIIAHFVVLADGTVVYTHDMGYVLNDAGGRKGIDIEFDGSFPSGASPDPAARLDRRAMLAGRQLLEAIREVCPIRFIHPHGQVQHAGEVPDKYATCCGADIWMNVAEWAIDELDFYSDTTDSGYVNRGIAPAFRNAAYQLADDRAALRNPWRSVGPASESLARETVARSTPGSSSTGGGTGD